MYFKKSWLDKLQVLQEDWKDLCQRYPSVSTLEPVPESQSADVKPTQASTTPEQSYASVAGSGIHNADFPVPKPQNTCAPSDNSFSQIDSHRQERGVQGKSVGTSNDTKLEKMVARGAVLGANATGNDKNATGGGEDSTENTTGSLPYWHQSKRWASQMKRLAEMRPDQRKQVGSLHICTNRKEFEIEKGTFLGIRWDGKEEEGTEVAVKRLPKSGDTYKGMKNEYELLRLADGCENIIRYMYYTEDDTYVYLATELWEHRLPQYMDETKFTKGLSKKDVFCEIMKGLQSLHAHDILHRDITPDNVVIDVHNQVLLKGFQHSCVIKKGQIKIPPKSTEFCWQAQETMDSKDPKWCKASDIFAAGLIGRHIETEGEHPFGSRSDFMQERCNLEHVKDPVTSHMLEWMLLMEHDNRPNCKMVLNHPYFWDEDKRLQFLVDLGNEPEVERRTNCDVLDSINMCSRMISKKNWIEEVDSGLMSQMNEQRTYNNTPGDLLRFIRNFKQHRKDYKTRFHLRDVLMWFPNLLPCVYNVVIQSGSCKSKHDWTKRENLQKYSLKVPDCD
ncbi:serine/threonine-protein kinase/endoribonuclease IRE1-like [Branchiostoma floridae x Branchiostoma belcheri]